MLHYIEPFHVIPISPSVRKYPIRKMNTTVNQNINDTLIDTDDSIESIASFSTTYSSSSEWKINSTSDNSTFKIKKSHNSTELTKD